MATFDPRDAGIVTGFSPGIGQEITISHVGIDTGYNQRMQNSLTMMVNGAEMLRVAQDGFYVRGVKVPVDDKEAETVYNAFKQYLVWAELNRR